MTVNRFDLQHKSIRNLRKLTHNPLVQEVAPLLGLYWSYSIIRSIVAQENPYAAFDNAFRIIQMEEQLGIFYEQIIQSTLIDHALGIIHFANWFYTFGYFPVLLLTGVLLYRHDQKRYQTFKLVFLLGLGFALVGYSLFPLAPPRMLPEIGFVDTQKVYGSDFYNHKSVVSFYNPYAAMPSLHFGWALLVGMMAWSFRPRVLKALGLLYPSCMAMVIVTSGNHYFLDIAGGGIVVGAAYGVVRALTRAKGTPALVPARTFTTHPLGKHHAISKPHLSTSISSFCATGTTPSQNPHTVRDVLSARGRF